jgi:hypothetical protein
VVTSRREADISLTMAANAVVMDRRRPPTPTKSISKWLVQGIVVATTLFALLDLYLLMTSSPH